MTFTQHRINVATTVGLGGSFARPTGDQEVAGSSPAGSATLFRGDWS